MLLKDAKQPFYRGVNLSKIFNKEMSLLLRPNIFFFSPYFKDTSFDVWKVKRIFYIFVFNWQFFEIIPSGRCPINLKFGILYHFWTILFETPFLFFGVPLRILLAFQEKLLLSLILQITDPAVHLGVSIWNRPCSCQ